MKRLIAYLAAMPLLGIASCIDNDIPYPVVPLEITAVAGEGFTVKSSDIDPVARTVLLHLEETTDIRNVRITDVQITEGAVPSVELTGTFDLRTPRYVTLSLYQDYEWTLTAEQTIERRFAVEGQIGQARIDAENRIASVQVPSDTDLGAIRVTDLKLGPEGITTYSPDAGELTDFNSVRYVDVRYHDVSERWMLYVIPVTYTVMVAQSDLWHNTATLAIRLDEPASEVTLQYRRAGDDAWRAAEVTPDGDERGYTARIVPEWREAANDAGLVVYDPVPQSGVYAGHAYEYVLTADGAEIERGTFETADGDTITDGDMEDASLSCFTIDNTAAPFWGSGNNKFTTQLCTQETFAGMNGAHCTRLAAAKAPVVGILASGNLFTGTFKRDGFDGTVEFGTDYPWTARPTAMQVKYHATIGRVDKTKHAGAGVKEGDQDMSVIYVAIVDWERRHAVFSGLSDCWGMWTPDALTATDEGRVIGYGILRLRESTPGETLVEATIPIRYYDKAARPANKYKLVISCSTSYYGDYMAGCTSNVLYLDDFKWVY